MGFHVLLHGLAKTGFSYDDPASRVFTGSFTGFHVCFTGKIRVFTGEFHGFHGLASVPCTKTSKTPKKPCQPLSKTQKNLAALTNKHQVSEQRPGKGSKTCSPEPKTQKFRASLQKALLYILYSGDPAHSSIRSTRNPLAGPFCSSKKQQYRGSRQGPSVGHQSP